MAPPIYFLPKLSRAQLAPEGRLCRAILGERGIAGTFEDVEDLQRDCWLFELTTLGPGGQSGVLLCGLPYEQPPPPRLRYDPRFQAWEKFSEGLWVGIDKEHPPGPADLRRRRPLLEGYRVRLNDQIWIVPVIRNPDGGTGLPCTWRYNGNGRIEEKVETRYRDLWEQGAEVCELLLSDVETKIKKLAEVGKTWIVDRCLDALGLNYRVGRVEQNLLGLVRSDTWAPILGATVDYLTYIAAAEEASPAKKNGPDATPTSPPGSTATSPGPEAASPATAPAEPSSASSPSEFTDPSSLAPSP